MMLVLLTGALLLVANTISGLPSDDSHADLAALCRNEAVKTVTNISQMLRIIELVENDEAPQGCNKLVLDGLVDLKQIIGKNTGNVCSKEKVAEIISYHSKYIKLNPKNPLRLPSTINDFFLGYGFKVSAVCKRALFDGLMDDGMDFISQLDRDTLFGFLHREGFVSRMISGPGSYNDLITACTLSRAIVQDPNHNRKLIYVRTSASQLAKKLQEVCVRSFRPVYSPLIEPLLTLSTVGFNFKSHKELKKISQSDGLRRWFKVIYLCESVSNIVFVDLPKDSQARKMVEFLSEKEVENLADTLPHYGRITRRIEFKPNDHNVVEDKILDEDDKALIKSINRMTERRNRLKWFKKIGELVKADIRGKDIHIKNLFGFGKHNKDDLIKQGDDDNKELVLTNIDDYMHYIDKYGDAPGYYYTSEPFSPAGVANFGAVRLVKEKSHFDWYRLRRFLGVTSPMWLLVGIIIAIIVLS